MMICRGKPLPLCVAGTRLPVSLLMKKWSVTHPMLQAEPQCQTNDNEERIPILQQRVSRRSATSARPGFLTAGAPWETSNQGVRRLGVPKWYRWT